MKRAASTDCALRLSSSRSCHCSHSSRLLVAELLHMRHSEINQMRKAELIKNDVLWLDIPMDDIAAMAVVQCRTNAGNIKCDVYFFEKELLAEIVSKISTRFQVEHEICTLRVMECKVQRSNKCMI